MNYEDRHNAQLEAEDVPMPICAKCKHNISCSTLDGKYYSIICKKHIVNILTRPFFLICRKYRAKKEKVQKNVHKCNCGHCYPENTND